MTKRAALPDETIISKIYMIRSQKVMLDIDLAVLYGVSTKILNQAVKRKTHSDFLKISNSSYQLRKSPI